MNKARGVKYLMGVLVAGATWANGAVISEYDASLSVGGSYSPVDQGWTQGGTPNISPYAGTETIGGTTYSYWNIGGSTSTNNVTTYRVSYANATPFSDPNGWTATAVVRVLAGSATALRDNYFEVRDGTSVWGVELYRTATDQGIGYFNSSGGYTTIGNVDVSSDYITLQLYYNPNGAGTLDDTLSIFVNGAQVGSSLLRSNVAAATERWTRFGDNASGVTSDARSQAHWNNVTFETGYAVVPEPTVALLAGLGLGVIFLVRRRQSMAAVE